MKLTKISLIMSVLLLAAVPLQGLCTSKPAANAQVSTPDKTVWTGASVSPGIQQAWTDYQKTGDSSQKLECFIVLKGPASSGDSALLLDSGFAVQMFTGTIGRGHMYIKDLPRIANNPIIRSIKLVSE